jgi:hypothetical protein
MNVRYQEGGDLIQNVVHGRSPDRLNVAELAASGKAALEAQQQQPDIR